MKKFSGFLTLLGIFFFFLWSTFYLSQQRKASWNIIINKKSAEKILKSAEGFSATKSYKKHLVFLTAKTATEYIKKKKSSWSLKDIVLTIQPLSEFNIKNKRFVLKSKLGVFNQEDEGLSFLSKVEMNWGAYKMLAQNLVYDLKTSHLISKKPVVIDHASFFIRSGGVKIFLNKLHLTLTLGSELRFKNTLLGSSIKSEEINYNFQDAFLFNKEVKIFHTTYKGFSNQLLLNHYKKKITYTLKGKVSLLVGGHSFKGKSLLFDPVDQSIEMQQGKIKMDESLNF